MNILVQILGFVDLLLSVHLVAFSYLYNFLLYTFLSPPHTWILTIFYSYWPKKGKTYIQLNPRLIQKLAFFQIFYRDHDNMANVNFFGHIKHLVKI